MAVFSGYNRDTCPGAATSRSLEKVRDEGLTTVVASWCRWKALEHSKGFYEEHHINNAQLSPHDL